MRKVINNKAEDFILLFLEKSITEKNLTKPTIDCYKKDLNGFNNFLKNGSFLLGAGISKFFAFSRRTLDRGFRSSR